MTHDANHKWIVLRDVQQPLIILETRAGFDNHGPSDLAVLRNGAEVCGKHGSVNRGAFRWPRNALRTRGIVKMRVAVNHIQRVARGL